MEFVLGPGFTMLYDAVKEALGGEILHFKPLKDLESTLDSLDPQTMKRMAEVNTNLGLSVEQIENLKTQMETGTQLVRKLSKLNCIARCQYAGELDTLNRSLKALKKKLKHEVQMIAQENLLWLEKNKRMQLERSMVKEIFNLARQSDEILAELARELPEEAAHTVLMTRQKMEQLLAFERKSGTLEVQPEAIEVTEASVAISNTGVVVDVQQESTEEIEVTETSVAINNTGVVVDVQQESTVSDVVEVNSNIESWVLKMRRYVKDKKTRVFKPLSVDLKSTLQSIEALIEEIEKYTKVLGPEHEEVQNFKQQMKNGEKLVENCSMIRGWKSYKKYKYAKQLRHWNKSLSTQLNRLSMQVIMDGMETVKKRWTEVEQIGWTESVHAVPKPPPFVVGLDVHLKELKMALLKDGVSMLVLSAPGGCGKTTLATMFCQDQDVKGKFKNIIFVTFSKKPSLALIVRELYQHMRIRTPTFPNEVTAVRWLEQFLNEERRHPLLLVLDDVRSGSEFILEEFDKFKMPNKKILVTSRSKFPQFGSPYYLNPLNDEDAMTLFHYSASLEDRSSHVPEDLVKQIVNQCKGFPCAITIAGRTLCGQPIEIWHKRVVEWSKGSILNSETELRLRLQSSLDALDERMPIIKECFIDLASFPEDRSIPAVALIDMWAELYGLDDVGIGSIGTINELSNSSLANLLITGTRKEEEADGYYSEHFVTQYGMLRDLAIHQTRRNSFEQEKRLIIDICGDQLPAWWREQKEKPKKTRLLSISFSSIDGSFSEKCYKMRLPKAEVLVLNFQTQNYVLPKFVKKMSKLKVLIVTNYGVLQADLSNFKLLGSLPNLKRIRLERISIPSISKNSMQLKSLQKISLFKCSIGQAFSNSSIQILEAFPNLVELNIDYCNDLVELPAKLCDLIRLKKLSITNCHKLSALPEEIGKLVNLEVLRLRSCTELERLPGSIKNLKKLSLLDIYNCLSIMELPEETGEMNGLRKINMGQCSRLQELPVSVLNLGELREVICDEETAHIISDTRARVINVATTLNQIDANIVAQNQNQNQIRGWCAIQSGTLEVQPEAIEVTENSVAISNTGVVVDVQQESTVSDVVQGSRMGGPDFGGAGLGALFTGLYDGLKELIGKNVIYKPLLKAIKSRLDCLHPLIKDIEKYNKNLDLPDKELENLKVELEKSIKLVHKCSKIRGWNIYQKYKYANKLLDWDDSLQGLLDMLNVQGIRDVKGSSVSVRNIEKAVSRIESQIESSLVLQYQAETEVWGAAPELPALVVGLDFPLKELKRKLLNLKDGVSMLVLTAPGGCGKTTLATTFCQDQEVKDTFGDNIFFVTVSSNPNLERIVQELHQRRGSKVPILGNEVNADNWLHHFLKEQGQNPLLLVLDDVWSGSESLLEKFDQFKMPHYKLLVTSRSEFRGLGSPYSLQSLDYHNAMKLFHHSASLGDKSSHIPEDLSRQIVERCNGFPLAIKVLGRSLCGQPIEIWKKRVIEWSRGPTVHDSEAELLLCLQSSLEALDKEMAIIKECFLDLGSFPEDQRIPAAALIDIWGELYDLDKDTVCIANLYELTKRSLANLVVTRKEKMEGDDEYYSEHFVTQHDILRELAIYYSKREPAEQRTRLIIDISENKLPKWWREQKLQLMKARLLSISTDGEFSGKWRNMQVPEVEVLVLHFQTENYALPESVENMDKLKALIVTNNGFLPAELSNFQLLSLLSNLKRIRLERISILSITKNLIELKSLQKISLFMCNIGQAFSNCSIPISSAFPNIEEMNIDYCHDLVELPAELCGLSQLKKLSVTNCHNLSALPEGIGKLTKLEVLRLKSCTDLVKLPGSMKNLKKLNFLDISDCFSIRELPEDIGEISNLRNINMRQCSRLQELPLSVFYLEQLKEVICDEETGSLWEPFLNRLRSTRIMVAKENINLNWLH